MFRNSNKLSFHLIENISVDAMNELLKGVLKYNLALILVYFIHVQKYFPLSLLNNKLNRFTFDQYDNRSKPLEITVSFEPKIITYVCI